jgi:diguanylate cyclase (GGDEF)-like protein
MRGLSAALELAGQTGRPMHALLRVDLDGFTCVQASFGDAAADRLVELAGRRIAQCLATSDLMTRAGEDEFHVLVACGGDAAAAWRVAELILHMLAAPYQLDTRQVAITACVGLALVRPDHATPDEVVRDALEAVHRAKNVGPAHCALFDDGMHEASINQLRLAAELRLAMERRELRIHYQPIVSCRTGELSSLEALLRWQHPTRGVLLPGDFIPSLARAELMGEAGRWTVTEVVRQAIEWRSLVAREFSIGVNVSARQLTDPAFLPFAIAAVAEAGLPSSALTFELTEDVELGAGDAPLRGLRAAREAGFRVCVDDFGTGYSSLSYLLRLPVDAIKLDRAFVRGVDLDSRQREVVGAIIRLAHALDLDVVAEGVEQPEELDVLRELECDLAQGHLFSRALSPAELRQWAARHASGDPSR